MILSALIVLPLAAAELREPGEEITNALAVTLPSDGLEEVVAFAPALLGEGLAIPTVSEEDGWWCLGYEYELSGAWVGFEVLGSQLSTSSGSLDLDLELELRVLALAVIAGAVEELLNSHPAANEEVTAPPID